MYRAAGVQQDRSHTCWDGEARRFAADQEEGKVATACNSVCYGVVRTLVSTQQSRVVLTSKSRSSYRFPELMRFFNARRSTYHTNPRIIDDVIYTPYAYNLPNSRHVHFSSSSQPAFEPTDRPAQPREGDLLGVPELAPGESHTNDTHAAEPDSGAEAAAKRKRKKSKFEEVPTEAEIFMFQYGTVVIWGMTEAEEKRFLSSM